MLHEVRQQQLAVKLLQIRSVSPDLRQVRHFLDQWVQVPSSIEMGLVQLQVAHFCAISRVKAQILVKTSNG